MKYCLPILLLLLFATNAIATKSCPEELLKICPVSSKMPSIEICMNSNQKKFSAKCFSEILKDKILLSDQNQCQEQLSTTCPYNFSDGIGGIKKCYAKKIAEFSSKCRRVIERKKPTDRVRKSR